GRTPIHNILKTSRDYQDRELILTMIKSSKNINQLNEDGESYLHLAVKYNHPRAVQLLLSKMSKDAMFAGNNAGDNALHYAMETGNTSMIQQLLAAGFDVNAKSRSGETALHRVSRSRYTHSIASCITLLAEAG
ncbi:ankyrin, partial [Aspergillus costaricaensis CBS 115574]